MGSTLPSFGSLVRTAWDLSRPRLRGLIVLAVLPLVPLFLFFPVQSLTVLQRGVLVGGEPSVPTSWFQTLGIVVLIAAFALNKISAAGMFAYLADPRIHGGRAALRRGWQRWLPYLWTELLLAVIVAVAMAPGLLLGWWLVSFFSVNAVNPEDLGLLFLALLAPAVLLLPGVAIAVRYAFAPLAVAVGSTAGPAALSLSSKMVQGHFWPVLGRLLLWILVQIIVVRMVSPLPILNWFVPYAISILGLAYLVALYQALRKV